MSNDYSREVLRRTVAQVCQMIGWQGINSTPLDILVHVLEKYILTLGTQTHRYAEQFNRTDPNLHDLGLAFKDVHVQLPELREYTACVPPSPCQLNVPNFPLPKESHLNFLKPGSQEVVTRPVHVHEYLPAMYPEKEKESTPPIAETVEIVHNGLTDVDIPYDCKSPEISVTDVSDKQRDLFKRPIDPVSMTPPGIKKPRLKLEDEDCHTREISSVMMTMSGFLSPAREGKLPEARTPAVVPDVYPDKSKSASHCNLLTATLPPLQRSDKKSKKNKVLNGKIDKPKKKERTHKNILGKQKTLENRGNKLAMHLARGKVRPSSTVKQHTEEMPPLERLPPSLENNLKTIKREVAEKPSSKSSLAAEVPLQTPPVAKIYKNPLVPQHSLNAISEPIPPSIRIKEEKMDGEKLTSQPDKSKLNIFKKISTKIKEEKSHDSSHDRHNQDNGSVRHDKAVAKSRCSTPSLIIDEPENYQQKMTHIKESIDFVVNSSAVDLSSKKFNTNSDVIDVDDDSSDVKKIVFKQEPLDDYPKDLSKPKLPQANYNLPTVGPVKKEKKERKRKERKPKPEKPPKETTKLYKKQQEKLKNMDSQLDPRIPPRIPSGFPMFPGLGSGLIPGPGLIPSPGLIPGGGLFSGLGNNPVLRGMIPPDSSNLFPNPFSLGAPGGGLLSGSAGLFQGGAGLFPSNLNLMNQLNHGFGQPPRMPQHPNLPSYLRRPSLEVIPLDDEQPPARVKHSYASPPLREKEKHKESKHSSSNSAMTNSARMSPSTPSPPKANPIIKMPTVKSDVTIKMNPIEKNKIHDSKIDTPLSEVPYLPTKDKEKDKSERKKDKLHKKEKKDKEQKAKKKKDKKDKFKIKFEKKKDKEEKHELKEKVKKDKKEKRKDKEKIPSIVEGLVPKLTLKLGPPSPMLPPSPDHTRRLNIKPVVKKDELVPLPVEPLIIPEEKIINERSRSPELARISALVTRPPKIKSSKHAPVAKSEPIDINMSLSPPSTPSNSSPKRKNRPPTSSCKLKKVYFKPIPKRTTGGFDDSISDLDSEDILPKELPPHLPEKPLNIPLGTPYYMDPHGNKVWICPACGSPDNGSPMIGCDGCDGWYHWVCVGIRIAPDDSEDWYCTACIAKRTAMASALAAGQTGKKRGRKPKTEKSREII